MSPLACGRGCGKHRVRLLCRWSVAAVALVVVQGANAVDLDLPNRPGSVKFAVLGDFGSGKRPEYEVAAQMAAFHTRFLFDFVITTGDNMIGSQHERADFVDKFERPFGPLLKAGVRFYATLGNHDRPSNRSYSPWNMNGQRYYTFAVRGVRFIALDSNQPGPAQLAWLNEVLRRATEDWRICYFHHPLYSSGVRHGPDLELRVLLEPIFLRHRVNVVFSGHEHVYERLKPQAGIVYFVTGTGGDNVRTLRKNPATAASFEREHTFTVIEVAGADLFFQTVSRSGFTVDAGAIQNRRANPARGGK